MEGEDRAELETAIFVSTKRGHAKIAKKGLAIRQPRGPVFLDSL